MEVVHRYDLSTMLIARTTTPTLPTLSSTVNNGWSATVNTSAPWFAHQINTLDSVGTITSYGSWLGPFLTLGADGVNPTVSQLSPGVFQVTDGAGNSVTIRDGAAGTTGATGDSTDLIFIRSATQPSTPAASSGVPTGWSATTNDVPSGSNPMLGISRC